MIILENVKNYLERKKTEIDILMKVKKKILDELVA